MRGILLKITHENKDYYLEWSAICDAPLTYGMSLVELKKYVKQEYGNHGLSELPFKLERVDRKGTSSYVGDNFDQLMICNRAGKNEKCISKKEFIKIYITREKQL